MLDELAAKEAKKEGGHYLTDEERNERLIRLYKQSFERRHPGAHLTLQLQEVATKAKAKAAATGAATTRKSMVVALKDVLKESKSKVTDEKAEEEDSDEDQVGQNRKNHKNIFGPKRKVGKGIP